MDCGEEEVLFHFILYSNFFIDKNDSKVFIFSSSWPLFPFWGHGEGTHMGEGRVYPWVSGQLIAGLSVSICGYATLLKGTSVVLWRCSGTFNSKVPYTKILLLDGSFVCSFCVPRTWLVICHQPLVCFKHCQVVIWSKASTEPTRRSLKCCSIRQHWHGITFKKCKKKT